jgi:hypothetical protein
MPLWCTGVALPVATEHAASLKAALKDQTGGSECPGGGEPVSSRRLRAGGLERVLDSFQRARRFQPRPVGCWEGERGRGVLEPGSDLRAYTGHGSTPLPNFLLAKSL